MEQVRSIYKGDLETLLNVILKETSEVMTAGDLTDTKVVDKIRFVLGITSQAITAWDLQEYAKSDGEDYDEFMKAAYEKVGNFERIEWEG